MKTPTINILSLLLVSLSFVFSASTNTALAKEKALTRSGFLGDYSGFVEGSKELKSLVWYKPGHDDASYLKKYNKIILAPVEIWMKRDVEYHGISALELKAVSDYVIESFKRHLDDEYPLVTKPGPDVMVIRIALTDIDRHKPPAHWTHFNPIGAMIEGGKTAHRHAAGKRVSVTDAVIEFEILDSQTGKREVAGIDRHFSEKYKHEKEDSDVQWDYLGQVIDFWIGRIRMVLDKAHGKMPKEEN